MAKPFKIGEKKHLSLAEEAQVEIQAAKELAVLASNLLSVSDLRIAGIMDDLAQHLEAANGHLKDILQLIQVGDKQALEKLVIELADRNHQMDDIVTSFASQIAQMQKKIESLERSRPQWVVAPEQKP